MTTTTLKRMKKISTGNGSINLKWPERYFSIIAGVKLGFSGIKNLFRKPFLGILKMGTGGYLLNRGITGHCEVYSQIDKLTAEAININIHSSFIVNKPRMEVYKFWRNLDNLPLFMNHLERVDIIDNEHSHWIVKIPNGVTTMSWNVEIAHDIPGELIGWSSMPGSVIDNAWKVSFSDTEDGKATIVDITIRYRQPAGSLCSMLSHIFNPTFKNMVAMDIQNFKQYMDAEDEVVVIVEE